MTSTLFEHADALGLHDLVGLDVLDHAVLVDAALVLEGVAADDRLVVLHGEVGHRRDQPRGPHQHLGIDAGRVGQHVAARLDRHDDLFERGVAGPLADAVDRAFDLARAGPDTGQGVGDGHAEVVVAMHGVDGLVGVRHPLLNGAEHLEVLVGRRVADGIGQVDGRGAALDGGLDAAAQVVDVGARRVLGRPFDVVAPVARARDLEADHVEDLVLGLLQLVLDVHGAGGQEGVDARPLGALDRLAAAVDVAGAPTGTGRRRRHS